MPRPLKSVEDKKATRSAANHRYYEKHKERILQQRNDRITPAPELWLTLTYHPALEDFVETVTKLQLPKKLYRTELEALMEVIELISDRWEESEEQEEESNDYDERLRQLR